MGLHDMHGNLYECADGHADTVQGGVDPKEPESGGSWTDIASQCRAAERFWTDPGYCFNYLGFRPALVPAK